MNEISKENSVCPSDKQYLELLTEATRKITSTRIQIARAASKSQCELYWWFVEKIVAAQEKYGWGKSVVEYLQQLVGEIAWGQINNPGIKCKERILCRVTF